MVPGRAICAARLFFADGCGTLEPEFEEAEAQYETEGSL